ncbi:MAG: riboflavin synthase [Chitinophagaceae bacterium]|nr:riboflavin synthase [Chitinophagaceae bacterium]
MFTGIIESTGIVKEVISNGSNRTFWIESPISNQLKIDQSMSHSGACLTVEEINNHRHRITAIDETIQKTNLGQWHEGSLVNLERCLQLNDRIDGHLVQGHIDATGTCISKLEKDGSWEYGFEFSKKFAALVIEKGSICLNGISLTVFNVKKKSFNVAIIPYTFEHTNIRNINIGDQVNLEFDMIGKYLLRRLSLKD